MTVQELRGSHLRLMDALARHPDWTNDQLAHFLGWTPGYVEQLFVGVFATYRVQTRTGAVVTHLRRRGRKARPDVITETMGLA